MLPSWKEMVHEGLLIEGVASELCVSGIILSLSCRKRRVWWLLGVCICMGTLLIHCSSPPVHVSRLMSFDPVLKSPIPSLLLLLIIFLSRAVVSADESCIHCVIPFCRLPPSSHCVPAAISLALRSYYPTQGMHHER